MLGDNIRSCRVSCGMTQEELAARVHVVRQTVSKWEKGLSVPDAEMLCRIAESLYTDVGQLLGGEQTEQTENRDSVAVQLSRINEQLAAKNRRARKIWIAVGAAVAAIFVLLLIYVVMSRTYTVDRGEAVINYSEVREAE